jgi:hypothetical protein
MGIDVVAVCLLRNWLRLHGSVRVNRIAQLFRWLEKGNAFGRNIDLRAGLRVASGAGIALAGPKTSEAANLNLVPRLQGSDNGVEQRIDDDLSVATGEVAYGGDLIYEVGFGHSVRSFRTGGGLLGRTKNSFFLLIIDEMTVIKLATDSETQEIGSSFIRCTNGEKCRAESNGSPFF